MPTSLKTEVNNPILCYYVNSTHQIQLARITNLPNVCFEKLVFPQQRLMFEALPEAILEIHTGLVPNTILSHKISCNHLRVREEVSPF